MRCIGNRRGKGGELENTATPLRPEWMNKLGPDYSEPSPVEESSQRIPSAAPLEFHDVGVDEPRGLCHEPRGLSEQEQQVRERQEEGQKSAAFSSWSRVFWGHQPTSTPAERQKKLSLDHNVDHSL